jgi:hypothetical protein
MEFRRWLATVYAPERLFHRDLSLKVVNLLLEHSWIHENFSFHEISDDNRRILISEMLLDEPMEYVPPMSQARGVRQVRLENDDHEVLAREIHGARRVDRHVTVGIRPSGERTLISAGVGNARTREVLILQGLIDFRQEVMTTNRTIVPVREEPPTLADQPPAPELTHFGLAGTRADVPPVPFRACPHDVPPVSTPLGVRKRPHIETPSTSSSSRW